MGRKAIAFDRIVVSKLVTLIALTALCLQCLSISAVTSASTSTSSDIFYFEIKENSVANTYVGKIAVKLGFTYRFNDEAPEFELDPKTGVIITTNVPTDRETKNFYNLVILSSSPTYPLEVKIKILDVNDNTPHWPSYINTNLSFSESAPIGTKVIVDTAIDPDEGHLHYKINANANTDNTYATNTLPFKLSYNISSSFLHLEVSDKLDRETQSSYVLNISAIDEGLRSSSVVFDVRILDSNDQSPVFDHSDYSVSLNESIGKDVSILQVRATDADEEGNDNSRISYYLLSNEYFNIDPNTGIIFTAQEGPINCGTVTAETNTDYWKVCVFTVFAHDFGTPRQDGRTYVTAKIQDSNNHSPVIKFRYFSRSDHASVDENAANGSVVAAISVVDLDHGLNGQTSLEIADGDRDGHFRLDSIGNSHIIRVNGSLDRERTSSYNLSIRAYDEGSPQRSSSAYLIIVVYDHNDHSPKFSRDVFEATITESEHQIGIYVSSLRATDLDEGINSNLFYSLSGPNSHYFKIDSITGLITTDKLINREEIDSFELRVTARDGGSNAKWAHALLKIKVLDINDQIPVIEFGSFAKYDNKSNSYLLEVEENSFLNTSIKTIDTDLGLNGTVDLSLLYDYNGLFHVDELSKRLTSTKILDYEECDSYKLLIVAKDRGLPNHQLSSTTTVFIKVLDRDDISPVVYPRIYYSFVPLNQKSFNYSIVISRVSVKDFDVQSPINFVIHSYDELVPQMFALTRNGEIKLRNSANLLLNKNLPNFLKFNVGCNGCRKDLNDSQINIYLINSEINSFSREVIKREYSFDIRENESIGTIVGRIDIDVHKYRLYLVSGDIQNNFVLMKNMIKINKPIDRELNDIYKLQIIAANNQYFFHIDININIIDVNDCHPVFYEKFIEIYLNEDSPPKFTAYKFNAYDPDSSNQMNYSNNSTFIEYKLLSNPMDLFFIESNELKLTRSVDSVIDRSISRQSETITILKLEVIAVDKQLGRTEKVHNYRQTAINSEAYLGKWRQAKLDNKLTVFVKIQSINRYRPRFDKQFYEISISESTSVNDQFLKINAIDLDGDPIGFNIRAGNINSTFGIFPDGYVYVKNILDRELLDVFSLTIDAFEVNARHLNRENESSISCQVLIHIIDVNDNRPQFVNNTFNFTVLENSPINTLIGQVIASDEDFGSNSEIHYSLIKSYYSSYVEIDAFSGYIWSKKVFDRESLFSFEVLVQAIDQPIDENRFSSQALIRIDILDANDNQPIFEVPINVTLRQKTTNDLTLSGDLLVSEDMKVNSTLATFKATDLDTDSQISYRMLDSNHSHYFSLDDKTGIFVLRKQLDRESIEQFDLIIEANDGHFKTAFHLYVVVEDVNDCPPVWVNFTHNQISLPENISIGSEIMKLNAFDADIGVNGLFRFEIQSSGNKKYFDILKKNLVVVNKLDYETEREHHLNLSAIDEMGLRSEVQILKVLIQDVNDCSPIFSQRTDSEVIRVSENIEIGAKLVTLQAFDCDAGDVLTYEIVSCDTHYQTRKKSLHSKQNIEIRHKYDSNNCALKINAKNGEIININSLDRELIESINLKVNVRDSAGHSDKKKIIFIIDDINDEKPFFISPNKIIVRQDSNNEVKPIGQIEAIDLDIGINRVITYKMQSNEFSDYLSLDSQTGLLTTKKGFDSIKRKKFMINVLATDGSGLSTGDNITFIILADNLSDLNPSTKTIAIDIFENEPLGAQIAKLQTSPEQSKLNKPLNSSNAINGCEYHIVNSTDRTFSVDSQTGAVYIDAQIDREVRDKYALEVLVICRYSLEKIQVLVNILDQNDNPPYLKNTSVFVHISESSAIDLEVFDLSKLIADEDTNNKFDFQIINCSHCEEGVFVLNRKSGVITLKSRLDREKVSQYRILFGVSDGIYLLTSALDIYIDDENDNIPHFNSTLYTFEIEENTDRGVVVGQIYAFDEDVSSRQLIYSIIDQNPKTSVFSLDARNGQFTLTKHLDYETDPNQYNITCEASDGTFKSEKVKVVFNLVNIEDNAPIFDQNSYKIEIYENVSTSQILCVSATDADSFSPNEENIKKHSKLSYYFDSDSHKPKTRFENFEIDSKSGCIEIIGQLDREKKSIYELVVIADDGTFKASADIQIKVLDVNDNYPVFDSNTPKVLKIYENSAIDSIVYAFKAYDSDEAPNNYIQYELLHKQSHTSESYPFTIGPIDGLLKISGQIDKEVTDSFEITVRANDYGLKSSEMAVTIKVIDVIDNAPQFEQTEFEANVFENSSIDDIVIKMRATDSDQTDKIYYKIISGDIYGHFKINDDYIVIAMQLDFEQIKSFELKVNAIDNAGNSDTANVRINVINVLDESPYFLNSPFHMNWCENEVGVIGQFEAILEKLETNQQNINNINNRVNYLLINNYEQYFSLNSTNGVLSVVKPIDREGFRDKPEIELRMIAIDSRLPRLTGEGVIHLTIFDINDNEPHFSQSEYKISLNENQIYDINKPIGSVSAMDVDSNDRISYHMIADMESTDRFRVNDSSGQIYVRSHSAFDRELRDRYDIKLMATDSKFETFANLIVYINDVNDCTPKIISVNSEKVGDRMEVDISLPLPKLNSILQKDFLLLGLKAFDSDMKDSKNSEMKFRLNTSASNHLKIHESNGVIKVDQKIGQNLSQLKIALIVTDMSDTNPLSSSVNVNLKIFNDNQYRESLLLKPPPLALSVSESTKLNETVYKFETIFKSVDIVLIGGDPNDYFNVENNALKVNKDLDFEKIKEYNLYFEANRIAKDYKEFQQFSIDLKIINENDLPPKFDHRLYNATVLEEVDETILVTQVIATDVDSDGPNSEVIKYKILSPTNIPFKIDETLGKIWTTSKIDREVNPEFNLIILAEDEGGLSSTCKVHITVADKNDNPPRFTRLFRANITENASIGTFIIQVTSSDKDLGIYSRATYNFLSASDTFDIDPYSGKVFVTGSLDREMKEEYLLSVSANDGSWRAQTTLTINILDENDSEPQFEQQFYEFHKTLPENNSSLSIGTVKAWDADKGANSLITYNLKHKSQYFSIDSQTGGIYIKQLPKLSYNSDLVFLNRHTLTVLATDKGQIPKTSEVKAFINILPNRVDSEDKNKANNIKLAVPYDLKNETILLTLSSNIKSEKNAIDFISIDSNKLIFKGESIVKLRDIFEFSIISNSNRIEVNLYITEPNTFVPEFLSNQNQIIIAENEAINQIIFDAKAKDNDSDKFNNEISYELNVTKVIWNNKAIDYLKHIYGKQSNDLSAEENSIQSMVEDIKEIHFIGNPFAIYSSNGSVYLKNSLDFELITAYTLKVIASDNGFFTKKASHEFDVIVGDVNDIIESIGTDPIDSDLVTSSINPDPMSIGVILVISFFLVLILVISTSFLIFHNQKKNQLRECNANQRKMTATIKPYLTTTSSPPSTLVQSQSAITNQSTPIHSMPPRLPSKQPDVVSPLMVAPAERSRPVPPAVPASIMHSHSNDNYNDNYSNILATAEHYDLENASSIAPSDIDIVYHYKGFRNRDSLPLHHRHAPLARLSPSVSELSSMPRILTLQDLSPQVPPCPPVNNRTNKPKTNGNCNEEEDEEEEEEDDNNTDDSFTCSEFDGNYEMNKKDKNMIFQRVW